MQIVSVKDAYGDPVEVEADSSYVYLYVSDGGNVSTDNPEGISNAALNPKKARKVAKALKRAAKEIEASNAAKAAARKVTLF